MKGIHLPNCAINEAELARIAKLGCSDFVDLDFWPDRWGLLPNGSRLHVRAFRRDALKPLDDAITVCRLLRQYPQIATIRIRNEPNLEQPGEDWALYLNEYLAHIPREFRNRISIPAPSPGAQGWMRYLDVNCAAAIKYQIPQIDAHIYGTVNEFFDTYSVYAFKWHGPLIITEYNFGAGRQYSLQTWADDYLTIIKRLPAQVPLCTFIWYWQTPDTSLPTPVNVKDTPMEFAMSLPLEFKPVYENYKSPNNGGPRQVTRVIVLHGSQSGKPLSYHDEFIGTRNYMYDGPVSCHAVWGVNEVAYPVPSTRIAWHAREYNEFSLGGEMVQSLTTSPIPDEVMIASAKDVATWCHQFNVPVQWDINNGIAEHWEIPPGKREGKCDIGTLDRVKYLKLVRQFYGLSAQRKIELRVLPEWQLACVQAGEDWTLKVKADFVAHLKAIGANYLRPDIYGWH